MLGINPEDLTVNLVYTLAATYDKPNGKFSLIFSESAIVDCHYVFSSFLQGIEKDIEKYKDKYPKIYNEAVATIEEIRVYLEEHNLTFCAFAYDLNGVLTDQSSYYLDGHTEIVKELNFRAGEIADALTLETNYTIGEPLAN